jgi:puromycin-sensitive aminopeptidase
VNDDNPYRLPRTVLPARYELTLEPDLDAATFGGTCTTTIEVLEATSTITVNAVELDIAEVTVSAGSSQQSATVSYDDEHERADFVFSEPVQPGTWSLRTVFNGVLNDKLRGFYRSTYTAADGEEVTLATTQFESTNARRAFPCWDEPDLKAVFDVTLVVPDDLLAVSCTSELSSEAAGDGLRRVTYAPTPIMSTYLLAFVVGPLEASEPIDVDGTPLRVIYPAGKGDLSSYAADVGAFSLRWFTNYFGVPYPGDKLDLVAIPDFAFGAMENLGCVTFREILLLVDPDDATQFELESVTDVIAHEIAHMWFGDLVTMKWWNGIWLKEAFATFMELSLTHAFRPDWERWVSFGLGRSAAFDVDSLAATRPIEYPVISPAEAEGMYDLLTYEKGAAVVRMLEQYLGEESFREGIRHYISTHAFANADTTDLWDALEEATGEPVRDTMDSWIYQGGYPLVEVSDSADGLTLSQRRFGYSEQLGGEQPLWQVPVVLTVGTGTSRKEHRVLLGEPSLSMAVDPGDWVLGNTAGSGFYRVRYDDGLRSALLAHVSALNPIERYGFVDDAWASVLAGLDPALAFIDLADRFVNETDLSVWQRLIGALGSIDHILEPPARPGFERFVGSLCSPAFQALGWDLRPGDTDRDNELRGDLIAALGMLGNDGPTIARCADIERTGHSSASVVAASVSVAARHGDAAIYERYRERLANPSSPQDERRYQRALPLFRGATEFDQTLRASLDGTIRTQDAPFVLGQMLTHREHGPAAWTFVKNNWKEINERFPDNSIPRLLGGIVKLDTPELAADTREFVAAHPVPQGTKIVAQHLEKQDVNVALRGRDSAALTERFA